MLTGLRVAFRYLPGLTATAAATAASEGGTTLFPSEIRAGDMPTNPSATPRVPAKARRPAIIFTGTFGTTLSSRKIFVVDVAAVTWHLANFMRLA